MNNNNITTTITNVMKNIKNVLISNKLSTITSLPINTTTTSTTVDDQNDAIFVTNSSMNINSSMNKSIRNDRKIRGTYRIDTSNKFIHDGSSSSSISRGSNNSNDGDRSRGNAGDGVDIADCVNISKCDSIENNSSNNNSSIGSNGFYSYINNSYIGNYMNRSSHIQGIGDDGDDDDESGDYSSNVNIDQSSRYYNSDNIISQHNGIIEVINHTIHDIIYQTNNYMNKSSIYINNMIISSTNSNTDDDSFVSSSYHSQHNQHNYYGIYDRQHIDKGGDIYGEKENVDYLIPLITNSHLINDDDNIDHNDESFSV